LELRRGERYCRVKGTPGFVLGRNPTETSPEAFDERFAEMAAAGESLARLHLMHGMPPNAEAGRVDELWAARWDRVFDAAERRGIGVIPVFTVWAQWNDGTGGELWHVWHDNPYNTVRGGPAKSPAEILSDTECRRVWLQWLGALVKRWQPRAGIIAWEPISELDLVTGATPAAGAAFIESAARVIRAADRKRRPVTVSLSGVTDWPAVFAGPGADIVQAHPYAVDPPYFGRLSDQIVDVTRDRLRKYGKPVLLGECGLDWRPPHGTLTESERALVGIRHALWASAVSGALSGRMLWWEDGYDKYERSSVARRYTDAAGPVARFVRGVSYAGLRPAACSMSGELKGAALAGPRLTIAWFRDSKCDPPSWPERTIRNETITIAVPGKARAWAVEFADTKTGLPCGRQDALLSDGSLTVRLPAFQDSIALKATPRR